MVIVFLHLIKPLGLFSEGALRKNVSALLVQEVKRNLCAWQSQIQITGKTREVIITHRWTPLLSSALAFHPNNKPAPRVSSLAWASLTPVSSPLLSGSRTHLQRSALLALNLADIRGPLLSTPLVNWGCSPCHLDQTGPFLRPKRLCFPSSGPDDKAPCPWTEAFLSLELGCRARLRASALSETDQVQA